MIRKRLKKPIAILLTFLMIFSLVPVAAFADTVDEPAGDPEIIEEIIPEVEEGAKAQDELPSYDEEAPPEVTTNEVVEGETPVEEPADEPSDEPTEEPAEEPTEEPVDEPTEEPVDEPSGEPVEEPSEDPSDITDPNASKEEVAEEPKDETPAAEKPEEKVVEETTKVEEPEAEKPEVKEDIKEEKKEEVVETKDVVGKTPQIISYVPVMKFFEGTEGSLLSYPLSKTALLIYGFGPRTPFMTQSGEMSSSDHKGIDLVISAGTPILAAEEGVVIKAEVYGGYGMCVFIDHGNGLVTRYGHMSQINVKEGQSVVRGQQIGLVGTTGNSAGPHLHFEVVKDGVQVDPMPYLTETVLPDIDFSSKRLIVKGSNIKDEPVIAELDGISLIQYETEKDAKEGYLRLVKLYSVEVDSVIGVAEGEAEGTPTENMTENANPFTEAENVKVEKEKFDVAVIDTGANDAEKIVSVLEDDGKDINGHGQRMIDIIKATAPESKVLAIKAIGNNGVGDISSVYAAIRLAIESNVKVINLSISTLKTEDSFAVEEVIKQAVEKGIIVVGAAGNNGIDAKLTIPGGIEEIIVVGASKGETSNYGTTVDYTVDVNTTSVATALVSGLILSDRMSNFDKDIVLGLDIDKALKDYQEQGTLFQIADGAGGGQGSGSAAGTGYASEGHWGYVYWDQGGWNDSTMPGAGNNIRQGAMSAGASDISDYMFDFWYNKIEQQINSMSTQTVTGAPPSYFAEGYSDYSSRRQAIRTALYNACRNALSRDPNAAANGRKARVIGVAFEYIHPGRADGTTDYDLWCIGDCPGKTDNFYSLFGSQYPTSSNLTATYGWSNIVDISTHNDANANEEWRHYAFRMALEDNTYDGDQSRYHVYAIAVLDDEPETDGYAQLTKNVTNPNATLKELMPNVNSAISGTYRFNIYKKNDTSWSDTDKDFVVTIANGAVTGTSEPVKLPVGEYCAVEYSTPSANVVPVMNPSKTTSGAWVYGNTTPNSAGYNFTVKSTHKQDAPAKVTATDYIKVVKIKKSSAAAAVTNGNSCYNMRGIWFDVYDNANCTGSPVTSLQITNYNTATSIGETAATNIKFGKYWVKERAGTEAGTGYALNTRAYPITIDANSPQVTEVSISDEPIGDPTGFPIEKKRSHGEQVIEDTAIFKLEFWANNNWNGQPTRTWHFESKVSGNTNRLVTAAPYLINTTEYPSHEMYKDDDATIWPIGTYRLSEVKAPYGFIPLGFTIDGRVAQNAASTTEADFTFLTEMPEYLEYTADGVNVKNEEKRADVTWSKIGIDGQKMANIPFLISLLDEEGNIVEGEQHVIVTDESGEVNTATRPKTGDKVNSLDQYLVDGKYTGPLDATTGVWFGDQTARMDSKGALSYGRYLIEELPCDATAGMDMLKQKMIADSEDLEAVFTDGKVFELGNIFVNLIIHPESDFIDDNSETKIVTIGENVSVTDSLRWDHLKVGQEYKLKTIVYYEDREGNITEVGSNVQPLIPERVDATNTSLGVERNTVTINTSNMNGGMLHAVDEIYAVVGGKDVLIASHNKELNTERQILRVPSVGTIASDSKTLDNVGTVEKEASITDIVKYENFPHRGTFIVKATLRYADTGEAIQTVENILVTDKRLSSVSYDEDGTINGPLSGEFKMPAFTFDASDMAGKTLVVTEEFIDKTTKEKFVEHYDLTDEDQSIHYIEVTTEAKDSKTGSQTATVGATEKIIDLVTIKNAIPGLEYTVTGSLVYVEDCITADGIEHKKGELIAEQKEPVTVIADAETIVVEVEFEVDSSALEGLSGVVFEDVWHKDVLVGTHHDYDAKPQTPNWPKVRTMAWDEETKSQHVLGGDLENTIVDTVTLTNLTIGDTYKVVGTLHRPDGSLFLIDGEEVTVESEVFEATEKNMEKEIRFTSENGEFLTETIVVYEKLIHVGAPTENPDNPDEPIVPETEVSRHEDPDDKDQTVKYEPKIGTTAKDKADNNNYIKPEKDQTIVDTVRYEGLKPNTNYVMTLTVFDKTANELTDISVNKAFVSDEGGAGEIDVEVTIDGSIYAGHALVMFEECFTTPNDNPEEPETPVGEHKDPEDPEQTVYVPEIGTVAKDKADGDHYVLADGKQTIVDTIGYKGLMPSGEYEARLTIFDKTLGKVIEGIEVRKPFTASESGEGTVDVEVTIEGKEYEGHTLVMFEEVFEKPSTPDVPTEPIAEHKDPEDEDQTIRVPEARTEAKDVKTENHTTFAEKDAVVVDTVSFKGLKVGETYTVEGTLMDKATGKALLENGKEVTASREFIAKTENGEIEITFKFDASLLQGKTLVAFEKVLYEGNAVAIHADINDKDQTIYIPEARTVAKTVDGKKSVVAGKVVELKDTVSYKNLTPGTTYILKATVMDKATGKPAQFEGKDVVITKEFTPENASGTVEITAKVMPVSGHDLVFFEEIFEKNEDKPDKLGPKVAEHKDMIDKDQTVTVQSPPKTGDNNDYIQYIALFMFAGILIIAMQTGRKREK